MYLDVIYTPTPGQNLDYASILDAGHEFTALLRINENTTYDFAVDTVPIPVTFEFNDDYILEAREVTLPEGTDGDGNLNGDFNDNGVIDEGDMYIYLSDQGIVQLYQHDSPIGEPVNLYSDQQRASDLLPLGVLEMQEGDNAVFLVLVGKDEQSTTLGLDAVELIFERTK